jgi:hypothetical protein
MRVLCDDALLREAIIGNFDMLHPGRLSLADFEVYPPSRSAFPTLKSEGSSHHRVADQLRGFEAFLVAVYGEAFLGRTTAVQLTLRNRVGRLSSVPPEFAFIAVHRRVCGWFKDLRTLVSSAGYTPGCLMETPAI